jgi:hypothetical protein
MVGEDEKRAKTIGRYVKIEKLGEENRSPRGGESMRKTGILWVLILLAVVVALVLGPPSPPPAQENQEEVAAEEESLPPVWNLGDNWTYVNSAGTVFAYSVAKEETYDGVPSYRIKGTVSPPLEGWAAHVDRLYGKETLAIYCEIFYDTDRSRTERFVRTYSEDPWPLRVGKTYTEGVTSEKIYVQGADSWSDPEISHEYRVTVEAVENVTVQAGGFESYRISVRGPNNTLIEERWYSDVAKNFVKIVDNQTGDVMELSAYWLS